MTDLATLGIYGFVGASFSVLLFKWSTALLFRMKHPLFLSGITIHSLVIYLVLEGIICEWALLGSGLIYPIFAILFAKKNHNEYSQFFLSRIISWISLVILAFQALLLLLGYTHQMICLSLSLHLYYTCNLIHYIRKFFSRISIIEKILWTAFTSTCILCIFYMAYSIYHDTWKNLWFFLAALFIATQASALVYFYLKSYYVFIEGKKAEKNELYRKNLAVINANKTLKERLLALENKALNNQINPHFLFNAINSINSLIITNDLDNADFYIAKLSDFLTDTFTENKSSFITLEKELNLLDLYVSLENLRRNQPIVFLKNIGPELNLKRVFLPHLFLQSLVENSIWHGLSNAESGEIKLSISSQHNILTFVLDDNGVGINSTNISKANRSKHKSAGLDILRNRLLTLQEHFQMETVIEINDFKEIPEKRDASCTGTRVKVVIPLISHAPLSRSSYESPI